jgi:two-component system, NtrC family, sensor histidine kinase KinB
LRRVEGQAKAQGITLSTPVDPELPLVLADQLRLRVVFDNILSNALKFTPHGGSIVVECHRSAPGREVPRMVSISIADNGPGIPTAFRSRIFEKFFRLEHHQTEARPATRGGGIGLYMCRQIVELHGGEIACSGGIDGRGTCITVTLPARSIAAESVVERTETYVS